MRSWAEEVLRSLLVADSSPFGDGVCSSSSLSSTVEGHFCLVFRIGTQFSWLSYCPIGGLTAYLAVSQLIGLSVLLDSVILLFARLWELP